MKRDVKLQKKVYIILLFVLLLAGVSQLTRSKLVLTSTVNEQTHEQYQAIKEDYLAMNLEQSLPASTHQDYCLAYDSEDELSVRIKDNTERVLGYMQQPYSTIDLDATSLQVQNCQAVLLTASVDSVEYEIPAILDFIENGGYLFWMRSDNPSDAFINIHRKLGIVNFEYLQGKYGITLTSNVLINQAGARYEGDFIYNDVLPVELDEEVELLATTADQNPLMWRKQFGEGAFMVFNGSNLSGKDARGLIAGGISLLAPDYIYPIFNTKLFYIDDFPAPIPQGIDALIYQEYKMDIPTFFHDIWWPQMLKAASNFNVKYTAVAIQTYGDQVKQPFTSLGDEELHNVIRYGREVLKSGGEIGVHGYNHQSLQMNQEIADYFGYKRWETIEDMEVSIKTMLNYLEQAFPRYSMMSYVPPSNVLDSEGRKALVNAWPNLAVIASLYMPDQFNRSYVQEFEMGEDGVLDMPRTTSGYFDTDYNRWVEANAISSIGVFSHFIHPDDLLDEERGRRQTWKSLYEDFEELLTRLHTTYPWLRSLTSSEAAIRVADQLQSGMVVSKEGNTLQVTTATTLDEHYFILRTDKKIGNMQHCTIQKIDKGVFLVKATSNDFSMELGR
ncbi:DUF2194 domain-containing protein [Sporosarcina sp. OR05]|uniref:DUF2194 domain-containing protein n=1 Tax=Sporosarcina sp. OR05 TaxID=2969819 RepID=UPI00352A8791